MIEARSKIAAGGRVVIPAEYRRVLGLCDGDAVVVRLFDGEVRILSVREAIRRAQEIVRQCVPHGRSLANELIAERRCEARLE